MMLQDTRINVELNHRQDRERGRFVVPTAFLTGAVRNKRVPKAIVFFVCNNLLLLVSLQMQLHRLRLINAPCIAILLRLARVRCMAIGRTRIPSGMMLQIDLLTRRTSTVRGRFPRSIAHRCGAWFGRSWQ